MKIKKLSQAIINRIAAGEVVDRPSSVVKELIENSIDAGAQNIDVIINTGGRNLITVTDDGAGMAKEDLEISILPHTTSKLNEQDISDIKHFGFRGEALPSIAAVSRMTIVTKERDNTGHAWSINIDGGEFIDLTPASLSKGTKIQVRDLFFSTPARLKFLKTERIETSHILDIMKKIAMSHPDISFSLSTEIKNIFSVKCSSPTLTDDKFKVRVSQILSTNFIVNSVEINSNRDDISLKGYASLPTFNKGTSSELYLYVNNRPVKDKILLTSVKVAYQDFLGHGRYPTVVLFLDLPPNYVDVNVHPNKTEVRFRDEAEIRGFLISSLRQAISSSHHKSSTTASEGVMRAFRPETMNTQQNFSSFVNRSNPSPNRISESAILEKYQAPSVQRNEDIVIEQFMAPTAKSEEPLQSEVDSLQEFPLGAARCQLHETYVIAQTNDSIILVDQHAAHERLVYEELKQNYYGKSIKTQRLLIPEIIEFDEIIIDKLVSRSESFRELGLVFEKFGPDKIKISEIPAIIQNYNVTKLINDIVDDIREFDENISFNEILEHVLGTFACHHSIRSGRKLSVIEMNSLLRKMESTKHSGQCNHGRPTYIELKLNDIEKLFGRT